MTTPRPMPAAEAQAMLRDARYTRAPGDSRPTLEDLSEATGKAKRTLRDQIAKGWLSGLVADKLRDLARKGQGS